MRTSVSFTHRTVFGYLHTPEMQALLSKHAPDHFKDAHFPNALKVAVCKMVVIDPHDPYGQLQGWGPLAGCAEGLLDWNHPRDLETANLGTGTYSSLRMAQALKQASIYFLKALGAFLRVKTVKSVQSQDFDFRSQFRTELSITLAMSGLFTFTDTLVAVAPYLVGSATSAERLVSFLQETLFQASRYDKASIIRKLLEAGLDPNLKCGVFLANVSSPWERFLAQLTRNIYVFLPLTKHVVAISNDWVPRDPSETRVTATRKDIYADPHIQDSIKTFIEFGAELIPETVEKLTKYLPKPDGNNFDWPGFLATYSKPAKRIELE